VLSAQRFSLQVFTALCLALVLAATGSLSAQARQASTAGEGRGKMAFTLRSSAVTDGMTIPRRHTCDGLDLSPDLVWSGQPEGTKSFVLVVDDPDAPGGTFVHWVLFDIAATAKGLPEGPLAAKSGLAGMNDFGKPAWGGPCPPRGKGAHRYFFKLHALDIPTLNVRPGASLFQIEKVIKGHVLATAQLMGRYGR